MTVHSCSTYPCPTCQRYYGYSYTYPTRKRKTTVTERRYENGELVSETVTETEDDIIDWTLTNSSTTSDRIKFG